VSEMSEAFLTDERPARVRDGRKKDWFHIDFEVVDKYLPEIGLAAFAVWCVLVRHADFDDATACLKIQTIQEKTGLKRSAVYNALNTLVQYEMLRIERREDSMTGKQLCNEYIILDCKHYEPVKTTNQPRGAHGRIGKEVDTVHVDGPPESGDTVHVDGPSPSTQMDPPPSTQMDPLPYEQESLKQESPKQPEFAAQTAGEGGKDIPPTEAKKLTTTSRMDNKKIAAFDSEFETVFWPAYPRKGDKKAAKIAYRNARLRGTPLKEIMEGLAWWKQSDLWRKDGGVYIKYAQGWLNQEYYRHQDIDTSQLPNAKKSARDRTFQETMSLIQEVDEAMQSGKGLFTL